MGQYYELHTLSSHEHLCAGCSGRRKLRNTAESRRILNVCRRRIPWMYLAFFPSPTSSCNGFIELCAASGASRLLCAAFMVASRGTVWLWQHPFSRYHQTYYHVMSYASTTAISLKSLGVRGQNPNLVEGQFGKMPGTMNEHSMSMQSIFTGRLSYI